MRIPPMDPRVEKPFRKALGHALRNEHEQMREGLLRLTDEQIEACLGLCAYVSGYIAIYVCGMQWPDEDNLRGIGEATTTSNNARAFGLKAEDSYAYVKRVALRKEPLNTVFSPPDYAATLSFVITGHILVSFCKPEEEWWEHLTRVEEAWEFAQVVDLDLLPVLMLRSRQPAAPSGPPSSPGANTVTS